MKPKTQEHLHVDSISNKDSDIAICLLNRRNNLNQRHNKIKSQESCEHGQIQDIEQGRVQNLKLRDHNYMY